MLITCTRCGAAIVLRPESAPSALALVSVLQASSDEALRPAVPGETRAQRILAIHAAGGRAFGRLCPACATLHA